MLAMTSSMALACSLSKTTQSQLTPQVPLKI